MTTPKGRQPSIKSHSTKSSREISTEIRVMDRGQRPEDLRTAAYPMSEAKFQKKVIYLLTDIRDMLKQVHVGMPQETRPTQLPPRANSVEELMETETTLKSLEAKEKMVASLSKIGGINNKDTAKNILQRLMANDVMSKFNMKGKKGKFAFKGTRIHQAIRESMLKEGVTEHIIDQDLAYCLKYAPDRRGGGGRKKDTSS
ncbi:PREDICTED: uncharacterized protein LOC106821570 [Priapulus caudatus]|uniref:Uncharacterized protein LOC106821570 n=1 Tax=Priapulus caudatus TaxID=37621 RepID=A0ABM1FBV5_PRICU|nr:PREDICTED: uncharacterized protein LOC106821570 [Priapulus caudatus]